MRPDSPDEGEWGNDEEAWRATATLFIIVEARGAAGARIAEIQRRFDPKLAARTPPHLTLTGSSGVGPLPISLSVEQLRERLAPIAAATPAFTVPLGRPERFMQTNTIVLPVEPHGPIRVLHDRVARSGLPFAAAKFTFTPHVTLNYFATLTNRHVEELLRLRVEEPLRIDHLQVTLAQEPERPVVLCELPLAGA